MGLSEFGWAWRDAASGVVDCWRTLLLTERVNGSCKIELLHYQYINLMCLEVNVCWKYIADILDTVSL